MLTQLYLRKHISLNINLTINIEHDYCFNSRLNAWTRLNLRWNIFKSNFSLFPKRCSLVLLSPATRAFYPGTPVFPSFQMATFPNTSSIRNMLDEEPLLWMFYHSIIIQYLFTYSFIHSFIHSVSQSFIIIVNLSNWSRQNGGRAEHAREH